MRVTTLINNSFLCRILLTLVLPEELLPPQEQLLHGLLPDFFGGKLRWGVALQGLFAQGLCGALDVLGLPGELGMGVSGETGQGLPRDRGSG